MTKTVSDMLRYNLYLSVYWKMTILFAIIFAILITILIAIKIQILFLIIGLVMSLLDPHRSDGVILFEPYLLIRSVLKNS